MNFELTVIGAGRLGGALAIVLDKRGYKIVNLISQRIESVNKLAEKLTSAPRVFEIDNLENITATDIIFITTPDPEIEKTAEKLSKINSFAGKIILHTSGSLSSEILTPLKNTGGKIGSLHPLVSISDAVLGAENFKGAYFCLEGDEEAVAVSQKIVADLEGNSFTIPTAQKPLYHASAVMSAGHLTALFDLATETLSECGLEIEEARKILLPLVLSTVENLKRQTPADALTGTFARADVETMRKHLAALTDKEALQIYVELGKRSLQLAAGQGADVEKLEAMRQELEKF